MRDDDCVRFLQWALPVLGLRWRGFRKPRRQVCRRIAARCAALGLGLEGYRAHLEANPDEWAVLRDLCRVTITRFRRDHSVWDLLGAEVLPALARRAQARGARRLRAWSCGCASGEEPATLAILWDLGCGAPAPPLEVLGTDIDPVVLERARRACWSEPALDALPEAWRTAAFAPTGTAPERWCLRDRYRAHLRFARQDVREAAPAGPFDLVLCRNLAFTYFTEEAQRAVLERLVATIVPGGALVVGRSETLPAPPVLQPWSDREGVWTVGARPG